MITLVLIAKCYFSWVHRERKKGLGGGTRLWAKTRIEKGKKNVPRCEEKNLRRIDNLKTRTKQELENGKRRVREELEKS